MLFPSTNPIYRAEEKCLLTLCKFDGQRKEPVVCSLYPGYPDLCVILGNRGPVQVHVGVRMDLHLYCFNIRKIKRNCKVTIKTQ